MGIAAHDAADRVAQLTELTERLTGRLAVETACFEARRPQDAAAGMEETQRLANTYRRESQRIKAEPALLSGAPIPARRALLEATHAFEAGLARHNHAVEAAKTITEGLLRAIAGEVASARASGAGYGAAGGAVIGDARAMALNARA
ncbi:MAG TPA: flagellar basal-body protein FlbY [Caulobacteraceae bacterium]|jgi:hypothetical protein